MKNIQHKIKFREIACNLLYRSLKRRACKVPTAVSREALKTGFSSGDLKSASKLRERKSMFQCVVELLKAVFIVSHHVWNTAILRELWCLFLGFGFCFCFLICKFRSTHRHLLFRNVYCNGKDISSAPYLWKVLHELDWIMSFWCIRTKENPVFMYESLFFCKHVVKIKFLWSFWILIFYSQMKIWTL